MEASLLLWLSLLCAATAAANAGQCQFKSKTGRVLLFSIRANSGKNALTEYDNAKSTDTLTEGSNIPALFRSNLLNDLPTALRIFCANRMVVEMQKAGEAVARAEFDVSDSAGLDSHNWFTPSRLVNTYPYWTGKTGFADFGIKGFSHQVYSRDFYIQHNQGGCDVDSGFMGIGESSNDPCSWVTDGGSAPVLFYAKEKGPYMHSKKSVVAYADQFIIYMKHVSEMESKFTHKKVAVCLKPEFIQDAPAEISSSDDCASHCIAQGSSCQGFRFRSEATGAKCQLFVFTKCSHDLNVASCNNNEWIHVRNLAGLPPGKLCPSSYGYRHGSSVYNLVNAASWHDGSARCNSDVGLTKYADASDVAEANHMHKIKNMKTLSFFIGGRMTSPADYRTCNENCKSTWEWVSCGTPVAEAVWDKANNQPNEINDGHVYTDIWILHTEGVDSTLPVWNSNAEQSINHALCECVDPFEDSR